MTAVGVYVMTYAGNVRHLRGTAVNRTVCGSVIDGSPVGVEWTWPVCRKCAARSLPGEFRA